MTLASILSPEQVIPEMRAENRWEAIDEMIAQLVKSGKIPQENASQITEAVRKRENSMSTGVGLGIGLPHASTPLISEVVGVFGRSSNGINFDALDGQPVHFTVLFIVPQGQFQKHLQTLSNIARLLHRSDLRQSLENAVTAEDIYQIIKNSADNSVKVNLL